MEAGSSSSNTTMGSWSYEGPYDLEWSNPYFTAEGTVLKTARDAFGQKKGPQQLMFDETQATHGDGACLFQRQTTYFSRMGDVKGTREYGATSAPGFAKMIVEGALAAKSAAEGGRRNVQYPPLYELIKDVQGQPGTKLAADVDGAISTVGANVQLAEKIEQCPKFKPRTPLLDEFMQRYNDEDLAAHEVKVETDYPKAMEAIVLTVAEGMLNTVSKWLSVHPDFETFTLDPRIFTSCYNGKLSFHVVVDIEVTDVIGVTHKVVFRSLEHLKSFYTAVLQDNFGHKHDPDKPHPFLDYDPNASRDDEANRILEKTITWLLKIDKNGKSVENAFDVGIATPNRVFRGPLCAKQGRLYPKLWYLRGVSGKFYRCELSFETGVDVGDPAFYESPRPPLCGWTHLMESLISYIPPESSYYLVTDTGAGVAKKRARRSAARARVLKDAGWSVRIPPHYDPFNPTFDVHKLCADVAALMIASVERPADADDLITEFVVDEDDGRSILVIAKTCKYGVPCRIKGSTHNGNNVYYFVNLDHGQWIIKQKCPDVLCLGKTARCTEWEAELEFDSYVDTDAIPNLEDQMFGGPISDSDDDDANTNVAEYVKKNLKRTREMMERTEQRHETARAIVQHPRKYPEMPSKSNAETSSMIQSTIDFLDK